MGRVRANIKVNGTYYWTLFDSGAENTYVVPEVAKKLTVTRLRKAGRIRLGGRIHKISKVCILEAFIKGKPVVVQAYVIDEIGYDHKARKPFKILFGAVSMQNWGIELDLKKEKLDLSKYPHEFVEF